MKLTTERITALSQTSCHEIASAFAGLKENQTIVVNRDRSLTLVEARRRVKQRAEHIQEAGRKAEMTPKLSILSRVVCESHLWRLAEIWSNLAEHFLREPGAVAIEVESLEDNIGGVVGSVTGCCTAHYESIICDLLQQGCTWAPNLSSVWKAKCDSVHLEVTEAAGKLLHELTSTSSPAVEVRTDFTFGAAELRRYLSLIKQHDGLLGLSPTYDMHGFQLTLRPYISAASALLDTGILSSRGELLRAVDDGVNSLSRTLTELTERLSMVDEGLGFASLTRNAAVLIKALTTVGAAREELVCTERSLTATPGVDCPAKVVRTLLGFSDLATGPLARLERNVTANLQWLEANLLSACERLETQAEGLLSRLRASSDTQFPDVSEFRNAIIEILEALHEVKQLPWKSAQGLAAQWSRHGCVASFREAFDGLWEEPLDVYSEAVALLPLSLETVELCNWKAEVLAFSESVAQTVGLLQLPLLGVAFREVSERLALQVTSEAAMTTKALVFGDSALIDALAQPLRQWTGRLVCLQDCIDVPTEAWKQLLQSQNLPVAASLAEFADAGGFSPQLSRLEGICAASSAKKQFQTVIQKLECFWSKSNLPLRRQGPGDLVVDVPFALADCSYLLLELQSCLGSLASWREVALDEGAQWTQRLLCLQEYVMSLEKGIDALRNVSGVFTASATDELSSSYVLFAAVKQVWNAVLIRAYKREITGGTPLLDEARDHLGPIREWLRSVEKVQNDVDAYILSLRLACPRFYFLSTAETIRCLSGTPESVEGVVPKLFIGVHRLVYNDSREISAVWSTEGEFLPLKSCVTVAGVPFPLWVTKLEAALASTLAAQTFSISSTRRSVEEILSSEYCEQVQLLAARALFTAQVEQALKVSRLGSLLESLTFSEKTLAGAVSETSKKLLLLVAYEKTVLERLLLAGVESANHPVWRNTLRTYIFPRERYVEVRQGTWSTLYGWEYLGTPRMLVMTPLTELAFLSMTTSMQVRYGLAPLGPAGSGKTETTKELARIVGKGCIIFNCSDGLDITLLSRFFHGVASTGCWICFDEFNRLDPGTLSQVTSHVMTLRHAQQKGSPSLSIDGQEVPLRDGAVVAITLNPAYAGRSRLPSDLQAIMRPIAMLKADSARITSASLCAAGFVVAEDLAERLVGLFQAAEAALPPSKLHDWGVRAALAVAASCSAPTPDEMGLLKSAVVREICPRLSDTEAAIFMPLLDEAFPSSIPHSPRVARDGVCGHLRDLCLEEGLSLDFIMRPAMDLLAALPYRRGHIIVTPQFTLDSTVVRLLHKAFSLQTPVDLVTVYPKSVGVSGLFGYQREHVWVEGAVHRAVRCVSVWVLCRGRLDPSWVENLNSALDDNSTLCLASGQRILLSNSTKFIFEVTDVDTASPATVSRCSLTRCPSPGLYWRDRVACTLLNNTARQLALEFLEELNDRDTAVCRLQRLVVRSADLDTDEQHKELWAVGWAVGASRPDPLAWFDRLRDAAALKGLELTSLPRLLCPQVPNASLGECVAQLLHVLRRGNDCHLLHCEIPAPQVCPPAGRVSVFSQESLMHFARDVSSLFRTRDEVLLPAGCVVSVDSLANAERDAFGSVNVCDRLLEMVCSSKCTSVIRQRFVSQSLLPGTVFVVEGASALPQEAFVARISRAMMLCSEMPEDPPMFVRAVADGNDATRTALLKVGPWVRAASQTTAERIVAMTLESVLKGPSVANCCLKFRCHKRTRAQHRARQRLSTDGVVIFAPETVYEACAEDNAEQLERWRRSHNHDHPGVPIPRLIFFEAFINAVGQTTVSLITSHVALVGPVGSGRQVVARLAATILGLEYRSLASLEDLKSAVVHIFTKGSAATPTMLLVPEAGLDLLKEAVFHLTSTCSFQFLFTADEIPAVVDILAADLSSGGHHDATPSQCWAQGRLLLERRARVSV
ncbi:MAG: hypothetical protein KVP17_004471 [Porospora cf. gigantea B]|uniref:uncharacterized protein n=1 Tax=Porospora cf. gigantea B TaxID=2853592 RepID=UPI003571819A|nr:MAG: hypothetical protein KVP17_004471 [Porospora cf. gigantea B]